MVDYPCHGLVNFNAFMHDDTEDQNKEDERK